MKIVIPGQPIPKARHRSSGFNKAYDPQAKAKTDTFWQIRSLVIDEQIKKYGSTVGGVAILPTRPILMKIDFYMAVPKSLSPKKKTMMYGTPHDKKPDLSNLIKFYEDCANSALFRDDAQIYSINATKHYDDNPRTEITIQEFIVDEEE